MHGGARSATEQVQHLITISGLPNGTGGEGQNLLHTMLVGQLPGLIEEGGQGLDRRVADTAVRQVLREAQRDLVGPRRQGPGAMVRIHNEHMDGVRANVDDAQSHVHSLRCLQFWS